MLETGWVLLQSSVDLLVVVKTKSLWRSGRPYVSEYTVVEYSKVMDDVDGELHEHKWDIDEKKK